MKLIRVKCQDKEVGEQWNKFDEIIGNYRTGWRTNGSRKANIIVYCIKQNEFDKKLKEIKKYYKVNSGKTGWYSYSTGSDTGNGVFDLVVLDDMTKDDEKVESLMRQKIPYMFYDSNTYAEKLQKVNKNKLVHYHDLDLNALINALKQINNLLSPFINKS